MAQGLTPPEGLEARGLRLWSALADEGLLAGPGVVLGEEACRLADRLEQLDRLLRQDVSAWAHLSELENHGYRAELVIDKAAAEARQTATTLAGLLRQLAPSPAAGAAKPTTTGGPASGADTLAARRRARLAKTAGTAPA